MIFGRSLADMGGKDVSLGIFLSSSDVSSIPCCALSSPLCDFCTFPVKKSPMSFANSSLLSLPRKCYVCVRLKSWSTQWNLLVHSEINKAVDPFIYFSVNKQYRSTLATHYIQGMTGPKIINDAKKSHLSRNITV